MFKLNFCIQITKDEDLSAIEKFVVDVNDIDSVKNMCQHARMVINCVGPVSCEFYS